jgi:DNA-binding LytR/AlgR family response regulator
MRLALCEDDYIWQLNIASALKNFERQNRYFFDVTYFKTSTDLWNHYENERGGFDLLILDVLFSNDMKGTQLAKKIRALNCQVPIIFVSHDKTSANEGYDVDAVGYLYKPIEEEKLFLLLQKALGKLERPSKSIILDINKVQMKIELNAIVYACANDHFINIYTKTDQYQIRQTLGNFLKDIGQEEFVQVNRSIIVSKAYIQNIQYTPPYSVAIFENSSGLTKLPVSKSHIKAAKEAFFHNSIKEIVL